MGNKTDLENERVVSREIGQSLGNKWNCTFLETSAKNRADVTEVKIFFFRKIIIFLFYFSKVFFDLVRQINRKIPSLRTNKATITYTGNSEPHVSFQEEYSTSQSKVLIDEEKKRFPCCVLL